MAGSKVEFSCADTLASNAASLIALAGGRELNGVPLADSVTDFDLLSKLAKYNGHAEERLFAKDFARMVLACNHMASSLGPLPAPRSASVARPVEVAPTRLAWWRNLSP